MKPLSQIARGTGRLNHFKMRPIVVSSLFCILGASAALPNAFAQGCAMCYTTAAAAGSAAARSLDVGILVLLVPTLVMFVSVLVFAIRRAAIN